MGGKSWTSDMDDVLRAMWDATVDGKPEFTTYHMAARIKMSKNAVVGRAHRIGLHRASPIIRTGGGSVAPSVRARDRKPEGYLQRPAHKASPLNHGAMGPVNPMPVIKTSIKPQPCCWPEGDPKQPGFRFCEAEGVPGRPYCHAHLRRAFATAGAGVAA